MASFARNSPSHSTCAQCTNILETKQENARVSKEVQYAIGKLVLERICPLCKLILQLLPESVASQITPKLQSSNPQECHLKQEGSGDWQVYFEGRPRGFLTSVPDGPSRFAIPQTGDAFHQLNPGLVNQWMTECESRHVQASSEASQRLHKPIEIMLVDVTDKRLIKASSRIRFIALSYVWGNVPMFVTTVSNRPALEAMGGLAAYLGQVPLLIRDAMTLVQSIGQRYLWVDTLCIEQDHPSQKHDQVANMDIIYGHAFFTIVALSAKDAGSPLPGVRPGTRYVREMSEIISGQRWTAQKAHFSVAFQDAIYETRGWTMQERLFSRRCLYLTEYAAYWSCCPSIIWSDNDLSSRYELCLTLQASGNFSHALGIFRRPVPQIRQDIDMTWNTYCALVLEYTQRHLTYSADTLNAFAGISAAFQERLTTNFTSGVPDCFLDVGLFWTPASLSQPMQRNENFSSWSWAGWIGKVRINSSPFDAFTYTSPFSRHSQHIMIEDLHTYRQTPRRPILFRPMSMLNSGVIHEMKNDVLKRSWDILCFSTFSTKIRSFEIALDTKYPTILDEHRRKCGVLYAAPYSPIFVKQRKTSDEIILLSKNRYPKDRLDSTDKFTKEIETFFSQFVFRDSAYKTFVCDWQAYSNRVCLVNVMLVAQKGEFAERLCLGCIHEDAWNASNPQKKQIILR